MRKLLSIFWIAAFLFVCPLAICADDPPADPADDQAQTTHAADEAEADNTFKDIAPDDEPESDSGETYVLQYRFSPGEKVRTEVVHRAKVQTTMQGVSRTAETQSTSIKVWEVNEVSRDGLVTFVHSVESIDMWQKNQGQREIHYNSQTDEEVPPGYDDVAKAVGVPLTIATMDRFGRVLKRFEKRPQPTSLSTQMTMPLPSEPVTVGQTWSTPMDIEVILKDNSTKKIQTRQQFKLKKVREGVAAIEVDTQILTPIHDPAIEAQLVQRLSQGTIQFDIASGRIVSQQMDLDRHVIGFSGPASSMHYVTRFTERLLPSGDRTARRPAPRNRPIEAKSRK